MKKVILITGASRGLGRVIYQQLLKDSSYVVYGTSRKPTKGGLLQLDITSEASVKKCVSELIEIEGQIDVLINNVGTNIIGSLEGTDMKELHKEMDTNFYGALRMIQGVMPHFRRRNSGQIINISSIGAKVPLPYNSAYAASKSALEAMSESLAYELDNSHIRVSLVQPLGLLIDDEGPNLNYVSSEKEWHSVSEKLLRNMKTKITPSVSKEKVAVKVATIIKQSRPKLNYTVGVEAKPILLLHSILPNRWFRKILGQKLLK